MIVIRPITRNDLNIFAEFSFESLLGMTNLPRNRDKFVEKIIHSEESFRANVTAPGREEYYFVLEDLTTGRIGGTCAILAKSTMSFGYYYRIETHLSPAQHVPAPKEIKELKIVPNPPNSSEICALYLQPSFRHSGQGRLLSLSRFLFIATFKKRFHKKILAEMRGYIDQRQISPFWDGIGRHFCDLSFIELMAQLDKSHDFVQEILPKHPIYISLLPKEVQEVIGKTHESTKPAYQMLLQENFSCHQEIDIFEGGPIMTAKTNQIRTVRKSALVEIEVTAEPLEYDTEYILANERLDFRACFGTLLETGRKKAVIHEEVAHALMVKKGDRVRYVTLH